MINILLPVAGLAKRFIECGYSMPKPLIAVDGEPMIRRAMKSLLPNANPKDYRLIFVVRDDHCVNHDIMLTLQNLFPEWAVEFAIVAELTQGTLCSCLVAEGFIRPDEPLVIFTPDVCFETTFDVKRDFVDGPYDGALLTFQANSPDHSYVACSPDGLAAKTAEKAVISTDALVGVYAFRTGAMFLDCARRAIDSGLKVNGEYYVAPIYNLLFEDGRKVSVHRTDKMYVLGTPADLEFYDQYVARYSSVKKVALCCDHSGFEVKQKVKGILSSMGIQYHDFGTYTARASDHYDSLKPCLDFMLRHRQTVGIAMCQTGQGFNIAANKVRGVRSAVLRDAAGAELSRRHNAANFFCLPTSVPLDLEEILKAIMTNSFDGGRHATRIRKIANDPLFTS